MILFIESGGQVVYKNALVLQSSILKKEMSAVISTPILSASLRNNSVKGRLYKKQLDAEIQNNDLKASV